MRLYTPRLVFLYQAIILVSVSIALGWSANELHPDKLAWLNIEDDTIVANSGLATVADIDVTEAMRLHAANEAVFIDARHEADYALGHIPGALSIPLGLFEDEIEAVLASHDREAQYVIYCSSITCGMAQELALALGFMEYPNVVVFAGGMAAWVEAGGESEVVAQ
ncbi:rhodanese-like domain-containing protein [Desulfovibrio ferrophilus]|uniref:Sulfurtransferase n=1 Tax=Desulfovibrio ferrophilus TaxID=241368 RepID=A0A2Z6AXK1_9BACT|nr:rhodanese-like domain-containing protein [Desulfovibrio ferrophilus]BBD07935.1 sulfurtransferase [Desulfovibrio ferrophilus]